MLLINIINMFSLKDCEIIVFVLLNITICILGQHDEDIHSIKYTKDNFGEEVPKKNHFIMFYTTW